MRGGIGERRRFAQRRGQVHRIRRGAHGDDLDGQGGKPDEHHGLHEAAGGDLRAVAGAGRGGRKGAGQDTLRHDALRERARIERQRDTALQGADRARRAGDGDASRDYALLHDHTRGVPAGHGGRDHLGGQRDLRLRHGRAGEDRASGGDDDTAVQPRSGQGHQDRIHGAASGREALRGGAGERGEHPADVARSHTHRQGTGIRIRQRQGRRQRTRSPLPRGEHSRYGASDEAHRSRICSGESEIQRVGQKR